MSSRKIKQYLQKISSPSPMLNGWALCPALTNRVDEVHIVEYSQGVLDTICSTWNAIKPFAVSIYCVGKSDIWLDNKAEEIESEYPDIAVLWHHPNTPRYINNQKTPSPNIPLLILQGKAELMKEKKRLKELGYYKQWKN